MLNNPALFLNIVLAGSLLLTACGGSKNSVTDNSSTDKSPEAPVESAIDTIAPIISSLEPNNNAASHSRKVIITGLANDDIELKSVVINSGEQSVIATLNAGAFTATISAQAGENTYSVIATDTSGNVASSQASFYFGSQASAGGAHSGVIKNGKTYLWGRNNKGQAGIGVITKISDNTDATPAVHPVTPILMPDAQFVSLALAQNSSSALDVNGEVWSWGYGKNGQLGLGIADDGIIDSSDHNSPVKIAGLSNIVAISRSNNHALLLKNDGTLLVFGDNSKGQLGDGTTEHKDSPVAINGLSNIVQISASAASYAIDEDGRLWAWGSNRYGQLGNGVKDSDVHHTPVQVAIGEPIISIASGKGHIIALAESGNVYGWGLNSSSQVGMRPKDTTTADEVWDADILAPKRLPWIDNAVAIWAKGNQSFVKRSDGKIYPWGQNMMGTLGIEVDDNVTQPSSPILGLNNVADLGNGPLHTLAIRHDGEVFAWGWSFEGSLGGGESTIHRWTYKLPIAITVGQN